MRKLIAFVCFVLSATVATGQSDCTFDYCGTVPLLGVEADQASDVFLRYNANGPLWVRLRPVPPAPERPPVIVQLSQAASMGAVGVYDLVAWAWGPEAEHQGAIMLDWASDGPVLEFTPQHLARGATGSQAALGAYLMPPGCRIVPRPWGAHDGLRFQILSTSEVEAQTFSVNGGPVDLVPPSPMGAEQLVDLEGPAPGSTVELCTGLDPPVGVGNLNLGLPVWVLFRFDVGDDSLVTRPWSAHGAPD